MYCKHFCLKDGWEGAHGSLEAQKFGPLIPSLTLSSLLDSSVYQICAPLSKEGASYCHSWCSETHAISDRQAAKEHIDRADQFRLPLTNQLGLLGEASDVCDSGGGYANHVKPGKLAVHSCPQLKRPSRMSERQCFRVLLGRGALQCCVLTPNVVFSGCIQLCVAGVSAPRRGLKWARTRPVMRRSTERYGIALFHVT
ncbi:hypothetical protein J6590_039796 [Homalodisca vitripennis]|nr:hypothetical protein J6590_039796 [Homalodisca vitripennis]